MKFRNLARYEHDAQIGKMMFEHILNLAKELIKFLEEETKG